MAIAEHRSASVVAKSPSRKASSSGGGAKAKGGWKRLAGLRTYRARQPPEHRPMRWMLGVSIPCDSSRPNRAPAESVESDIANFGGDDFHIYVNVFDGHPLCLDAASAALSFVHVSHVSSEEDDARPHTGGDGNYNSLMRRQEAQVRRGLREAARDDVDWLFHIDDDELLHFAEPFQALLASVPPTAACVVLQNVEGIPSATDSECIFDDIHVFMKDVHKLLSYANGKAAGRVGACTWLGPHRYTGASHVIETSRACLLHFESCTYEAWRNKFAKHREMDAASKARIPFPFYRESISLFQRHPDGGKDEELWKDFFQKRKIDAMHRLPEAMKLRVTVKYPPPQMINVL